MSDSTEFTGPRVTDPVVVVYGMYALDGFALLEQQDLIQRSREMRAVASCKTLGELREVAPSLCVVTSPVPFDDGEYLGEEINDSQPFDWLEAADNSEGDWPGMPTALVFDWATDPFLDALKRGAGATVVHTSLNGPYLEIPEEREAELLKVFEALGIQYVRDDAVIGLIGALWDTESGRSRL